jgi:hypothetical protein
LRTWTDEGYEAIDDLLLVLIRSVYELRVSVSCMSSVVWGRDMIQEGSINVLNKST